MAAVERSQQVKRYYDLTGSHGIKFSRYGARQAQVEQRDLPAAKIFGESGMLDHLNLFLILDLRFYRARE